MTQLAWAEAGLKEQRDAYQPLEEIYMVVQNFLQQDRGGDGVSIQVSPLDSRLRLKRCDAPLTVDYQRRKGRAGRAIVEVRCLEGKPWRIYVTATISEMRDVVVTIAPILKGEKVRIENLALESRNLAKLRRGFFESKEQLMGKFTKRAIQGGAVITPQQLFVPNLIDKGDQVSIQIQKGELQVQMKGVAMENGFRDGRIRVKNSSSGKVVEGVVAGPGLVVVSY